MFGNKKGKIREKVMEKICEKISEKEVEYEHGRDRINDQTAELISTISEEGIVKKKKLENKCVDDILGKLI